MAGTFVLLLGACKASPDGKPGDGDADAGGGATGDGDSDGAGGGGGESTGDGDMENVATGGSLSEGDVLSARYPGDEGIESDPAVLFFDDFEEGWTKWNSPTADTQFLTIESGELSHSGDNYLRSTVTKEDLEIEEYISSSTRLNLARPTETLYFRFYAQFKGISVTPHHWVRVAAGDDDYESSGLANTVPAGDDGFWFDFDASTDDVFNFYVYWHQMRSGRCNNGTAEPGCEGDQGSTYHYGNVFRPPEQSPFPRDEWICIEMRAEANTVGQSDGSLAFWIGDELVGEYRAGSPEGTWLRDSFHVGGCDFSACTEPEPFEGFDFRTSSTVHFKQLFLDAYYERGSTANKRTILEARGLSVLDEQTIYYDDVVVAEERIGCRR